MAAIACLPFLPEHPHFNDVTDVRNSCKQKSRRRTALLQAVSHAPCRSGLLCPLGCMAAIACLPFLPEHPHFNDITDVCNSSKQKSRRRTALLQAEQGKAAAIPVRSRGS